MHPNGALPAYEWGSATSIRRSHLGGPGGSTRPTRSLTGKADHDFLKRIFNRMTLNFTWWVNRKDGQGRNMFQGGFLGLDNIGIFDRSGPHRRRVDELNQSDGTAWMAMYALNLMRYRLGARAAGPRLRGSWRGSSSSISC